MSHFLLTHNDTFFLPDKLPPILVKMIFFLWHVLFVKNNDI